MTAAVLGLGIAGLLLSAFFSGAETGFYRATRLRLVLDALGGDTVARALLFLTNRPALFVATVLAGTSLANYLVSLAVVVLSEAMFPTHPHWAELMGTLLLAPVLLVYGELLPKKLFLQAPNRLLRWGGALLVLFVVVLLPIGGLLWGLSRLLGRLMGKSPEPVRLVLARRELGQVLDEGREAGILEPAQRKLAQGVFSVAAEPVTRFLVSAEQFPLVRPDMPREEILATARRHGTALVLLEAAERPGEPAGYVRVIDLRLGDGPTVPRRLLNIPADGTHLAALTRLEGAGESLARIVGAAGETVGLTTIERLREPLLE
jgi:putative hemolysin